MLACLSEGLLLAELDRQARELNISRQAVIKTLLRQGLISITHQRQVA
jgi:hypothetical protein